MARDTASPQEPPTRGERYADGLRDGIGSWTFIAIQTVVVTVWVIGNAYFAFVRFDKYPFILLNLMFSVEAAYASPVILMAQRRADDVSDQMVRAIYANTEAIAQTTDAIKTLTHKTADKVDKVKKVVQDSDDVKNANKPSTRSKAKKSDK